MTSTLQPRTHGMAIVTSGNKEACERGVTATGPFGVPHARAHVIDLLVMRVSLAALTWAQRRADRARLTREEQQRRYRVARELEQRDHHLRLTVRAF